MKIAEVPSEFFDQNAGEYGNIESLVGAFARLQRREWEASAEGQAELRKQEARTEEWQKQQQEEAKQQRKEQQEGAKRQREEAIDLAALKAARDEAFDEVGITLDRRDRDQMHQIVFLLKKSIHETLRQAAFDNRMTMQSILRSGLMMWFIAHGYTVPTHDMKLPSRKDQRQPRDLRRGGAA